MIKVIPVGGLCNKLRVTFSYYKLAKSQNKQLEVVWNSDNACEGFFLDYFEEVPGIIFRKANISNNKVFYKGCGINNSYPPTYECLKLKPSILSIINKKLNEIGPNFIAIHVRRTDHILLAKSVGRFTTDEQFIEFINQYPTNLNIYLATDNRGTQDRFIDIYKNRLKIFNLINPNNKNLRKTSLKDTIVDIYICKEAKYYKGSGYSSLSEFINKLREC
jgi:hypothetical protein